MNTKMNHRSPTVLSCTKSLLIALAFAGCAGPGTDDEAVDPGQYGNVLQPLAEQTINPIDFMRNTSGYPTLVASDGSIVSFYETGNRFYYVKNKDRLHWERYVHDGTNIALERDTSWPASDGGGNDAYDAMPYGSLVWAKERNWTSGPSHYISFKTTIVGYNYDSSKGATCRYDWAHPNAFTWGFNNETSAQKWFDYVPAKCWGGNVGCVDSIGIKYNGGSETHWYARGLGWVAWEGPAYTVVWNQKSTTAYTPSEPCSLLATWPAYFKNTSTQRTLQYGTNGEWDQCRGKATCAPNEAIAGISEEPGAYGRTALCRVGSGYSGTYRATLTLDAGSDQRRSIHSNSAPNKDWAEGYFKLECGLGEYVVAVSENAAVCFGNYQFHGIVCAAYGGTVSTACSARAFDNGDNRGAWVNAAFTSGDWDFGTFKGECGLNEYVAGVSINPSTRQPHSLLCCAR
jgi:hypothetical protein